MSKRIVRTGVRLQMWAMERITRELEQLPPEDRQVVVNWFASQDWSMVEGTQQVDPRQQTLSAVS